jgi:RNA ligase
MGWTPIFEWCSNKNRIVLDYPEDRLVLTAVRSFQAGYYYSHRDLEGLGRDYGIEVVKAYDTNSSKHPSYVVDMVRQAEDMEGIVVRFDDGHMVKIKADWYVRIHKVKALLGQERDVVALILNNELDDLLPVLPKEDVERVEKFEVAIENRLKWLSETLAGLIIGFNGTTDRKTFALNYAPDINPVIRGMIFQFWDKECDGHLTYQAIVAMILKHCGNNASYAKVKEAFLQGVDYA